jgi:hypothetical protein
MPRSRPIAFLSLPALLAACASTPAPVALPPALALVPGETWVATLPARGVQVYECRAAATGGPAWTFVAPEAELFEQDGRPGGRHGAGPYWQVPDGSRLEATVAARAEAPVAGAIPWLLLAARSTGGAGRLAPVTHIRRVNTNGGLAPAAGCDAATVGQQARVSYTADYLFHTRP